MVPVTVATSFSHNYVHRRLISVMLFMQKLNAVVLIVTGSYMILILN